MLVLILKWEPHTLLEKQQRPVLSLIFYCWWKGGCQLQTLYWGFQVYVIGVVHFWFKHLASAQGWLLFLFLMWFSFLFIHVLPCSRYALMVVVQCCCFRAVHIIICCKKENKNLKKMIMHTDTIVWARKRVAIQLSSSVQFSGGKPPRWLCG